jgi:hypothetical protein
MAFAPLLCVSEEFTVYEIENKLKNQPCFLPSRKAEDTASPSLSRIRGKVLQLHPFRPRFTASSTFITIGWAPGSAKILGKFLFNPADWKLRACALTRIQKQTQEGSGYAALLSDERRDRLVTDEKKFDAW